MTNIIEDSKIYINKNWRLILFYIFVLLIVYFNGPDTAVQLAPHIFFLTYSILLILSNAKIIPCKLKLNDYISSIITIIFIIIMIVKKVKISVGMQILGIITLYPLIFIWFIIGVATSSTNICS
jgi:hypothetical protein